MSKIRLHAHIPEYADGTSWYRGAFPLIRLARKYRDELELKLFCARDKPDWWHIADSDLVFLQRAFSPNCAEFFGIARTFGCKAIADWDDNFGEIHASNPVCPIYDDEGIRKLVKGLRKEVNAIWTTTPYLAKQLDADAEGSKTVVVPNAWEDELFPMVDPGENNTLVWRGGSSHIGDLLEVQPQLQKFAREFPLWHLTVIGDKVRGGGAWPFAYCWPKDRLSRHDWHAVPIYFKLMLQTKPAIVIVPLQDNSFNHSKSNIAWMEAMASGSVCVCPDWEEWRRPGTFRYKSLDDFYKTLKEAVSTPRKKRREMTAEGQEFVKKNLLLTDVNEKRWETIKGLV